MSDKKKNFEEEMSKVKTVGLKKKKLTTKFNESIQKDYKTRVIHLKEKLIEEKQRLVYLINNSS